MQNQREQPSEEQDLADCEDDRIPTLLNQEAGAEGIFDRKEHFGH